MDEELILILVHFFSYRKNPVWHSKKQRKVISIPSTMALSAESEQLLAPLRAAVKVMLFFKVEIFNLHSGSDMDKIAWIRIRI